MWLREAETALEEKITIYRAAELLGSGEISSVELTRAAFERIEKLDTDIGAFLALDREGALLSAQESDRRRAEGKSRGIFDGIPYSLKDNISTKGIVTTCGSRMLEGYIPPYDASVVVKLKDSGAVLLGKNNMDEFAMGSDCTKSAYKLCKNPHDLTRVSGGSSGGSAASVSSDMSVFSLGSDTGGSVRLPASHCGVVGLKPTYGAVSRYGLIAYASSFDVIGTFCKSIADTRAVFELIRGIDKRDFTSIDLPKHSEDIKIKGLRIAIPDILLSGAVSIEVRDAIERCACMLESYGAFVEKISIPSVSHAASAYYIIAMAEASSNLARYDGIRFGHRSTERAADVNTMISLSRDEGFGDEVKRRILAGTYILSEGYYDRYYSQAQKVRAQIRRELMGVLSEYDALLSPVSGRSAGKINNTDFQTDMYRDDIFTVCANLTGMPAISVPCPNVSGMPIGVQFMAAHGREDILFFLGDMLERGMDA